MAWLVLLVVTAWIYSPGIDGPELLDDKTSVLNVDNFGDDPESLAEYVFGDGSGLLGRPVPLLTFALERIYFSELATSTKLSKSLNIAVHLLNGSLVFFIVLLLLDFLCVPWGRPLALMVAACWLLHPLHVSTVLYMVQRMTLLACCFMLLAMLFYVIWRRSLIRGEGSMIALILVPCCVLLGMLSKENAVVAFPILVSLELLWFRFLGANGELKWLRHASYGLCISGVIAVSATLYVAFDWLDGGYGGRHFSMGERLLTQARVVWDYVGQWFFPNVSRLGIYHDDWIISTSLFKPLTTFYSVFAWLTLVLALAVFVRWKWGRYLVFASCWFLFGHAVESTIVSLELYFEHRNYFPTVGLVLVPAILVARILVVAPAPKVPLLVLLGMLNVYLAALTASQTEMWSNRQLLVINHLNGHPNSPRANGDMAVQLALLGDETGAHRYSQYANYYHPQERHGDRVLRDITLSCLADSLVKRSLIESFGAEDRRWPLRSAVSLQSLIQLVSEGRCRKFDAEYFADRMAYVYLSDGVAVTGPPNIYSSLAILENQLTRYDQAYLYVRRYRGLRPNNVQAILMQLQFALQLGKEKEVESLIEELQVLAAQGKLNVEQDRILQLYLMGQP